MSCFSALGWPRTGTSAAKGAFSYTLKMRSATSSKLNSPLALKALVLILPVRPVMGSVAEPAPRRQATSKAWPMVSANRFCKTASTPGSESSR